MPITYRLRTLDNEDAGTFATNLHTFEPGMTIIGQGNRRYRIVSQDEHTGIWWVEPIASWGLLGAEPVQEGHDSKSV